MFDLRDLEFKKLLIQNLVSCVPDYHYIGGLTAILKKEKITNDDILKFYFYSCDYNAGFISNIITMTFFNYKMRKISGYRLGNFLKIVKENYDYTKLSGKIDYNTLYYMFDYMHNDDKFCKLVDIFLDEI